MNEQQGTRQEIKATLTQQVKGQTEQKFNVITDKWITLCAKTLSLDKLVNEIEPTVPEIERKEIRGALSQGQAYMVQELKKAVKEEIEKTDLISKMHTLDKLIQESNVRTGAEERCVPTAEQVMRGVICKKKGKETEILRIEYERIKKENSLLLERYSNLQNQLREKTEHLTKDLEKYRKSISIANSINEEQFIDAMNKMDLLD